LAECVDRRAARHGSLQEEQSDDGRDARLRQSPLVRGGILLGAAGGVFAEEVVDYRLRVADFSQRVAEILGGSRVRSGEVDGSRPTWSWSSSQPPARPRAPAPS
jgi:hypothetical protein